MEASIPEPSGQEAPPHLVGGDTVHRSRSFWFDTADRYAASEPLRGQVSVDVCVLGGGITGLSAAYHLRVKDQASSVAVIESEVVGYGASGRNAGQLIVQFGGGNWKGHLHRYGAEKMGAGWKYTHDGIKLIETLLADEDVDCDYRPTGYLKVTLRVEGDRALEEYVSFLEQTAQMPFYQRVDEAELEGDVRSPYLGSGLYDVRGGQFNPLKLVRGLKRAAIRRGAEVFENSPVAQIEQRPDAVYLHTGMGSIRCKKLIIAANGYTQLIGGARSIGLENEQTPLLIKAHVTAPLTREQWQSAGWSRRCGINVVSDMFFSFAPTADGRILSVAGYYADRAVDRSLLPETRWQLRDEMPGHIGAFFPRLAGVQTAQTWGGPISITADWMPHVGQTRDPRILYACGCWGNGMALGTHNGLTLAELALEQQTENTSLWFVRRPKRRWPGQILTGLLTKRVVAARRNANRTIGARLSPPVIFPEN